MPSQPSIAIKAGARAHACRAAGADPAWRAIDLKAGRRAFRSVRREAAHTERTARIATGSRS